MANDFLVVLSFGVGSLQSGFSAITVHLWEPDHPYPIKLVGHLPAAPQLASLYQAWQLVYRALCDRLDLAPRLEIDAAGVTNVSEVEFAEICQQMVEQINLWLNGASFRPIDQQLRLRLSANDAIRLLIETDDPLLQRLPWHLWSFFKDYPRAEVALSAPGYQRPMKLSQFGSEDSRSAAQVAAQSGRVKILAILGNSNGIDVAADRALLEQLTHEAEIVCLVEPSRRELTDRLWQGWDILFFAGHSSSESAGVIQLNQTDALSLEQLRYALSRAISPPQPGVAGQGLQLAIFNSCDGLGLAQQLADLHIPQVIVMREPVPDAVAQQFLRDFLRAFVHGQTLYDAVREARERLQGLESEYPCASWLPIICQNPAVAPVRWQEWVGGKPNEAIEERENIQNSPFDSHYSSSEHSSSEHAKAKRSKAKHAKSKFLQVLLTSVVLTTAALGVRWLGWLQPWELQAFDQVMRSRPIEPPDPRLLIVTVTEADFQLPEQRQRQGSLADQALVNVLNKLEPAQPSAIGLDIYRDFAATPTLAARLRRSDRVFAICKVRDLASNHPGVAPPPEVPLERQGFSDILPDADGVLRRQLIAMQPVSGSPCTAPYALSAQLALHYLQAQGRAVRYTSDGTLQIGNVLFQRLRSRTSGYQSVDAWGYQILLNYRAAHPSLGIASTVTLSEVLAGKVKPEQIKNRIVLIGVTAETAHDTVSTPYSTQQGFSSDMPGVLVQAQMVSQIVSAVQDGRSLLHVWSLEKEWLWVWGWAIVGGGLVAVGSLRSLGRWVLVRGALLGLALVALGIGCLVLCGDGYWVPLVPASLALLGTGGSVMGSSLLRLPQVSNLEARQP